jgi:uncharacterized protein
MDVNVTIALIDQEHLSHGDAWHWFEMSAGSGWATCPIVENGTLRIVSNARYRNAVTDVSAVRDSLSDLTALPGHRFWADDFRLIDAPEIDFRGLSNPKHLTDTYLLALAIRNGGKLVTFDRKLRTSTVVGGQDALIVIGADHASSSMSQ